MTFENEGIRVEDVKICYLCRRPGIELYGRLRDRLFGVPGVWNLLKCSACNLLWLDPQPVREDIGKLYANYYTHGDSHQAVSPTLPPISKIPWRQKAKHSVLAEHFGYPNPFPTPFLKVFGKAIGGIPLLRDVAGGLVREFPWVPNGTLLDVGCGDGEFLAMMRGRGWKVRGVEPDPAAVEVAHERYGLDVSVGTLEDAALPAASFDGISLTQVIEHVPDPIALLTECRRVLRAGGRLIVETPNTESWGHQRFKASWRGLETPRHLFLFSLASLRACAQKAGLKIINLRSTSRGARMMYRACLDLEHEADHPKTAYRPGRRVALGSWVFLASTEARRLVNGRAGDMLILTAERSEERPAQAEANSCPKGITPGSD